MENKYNGHWDHLPLEELHKTIDLLSASGDDPALLAIVKRAFKSRGGHLSEKGGYHPDSRKVR